MEPAKENKVVKRPLWWKEDWTQELVIFFLGSIALLTVIQMDWSNPETIAITLVTNIASGFIGYLTGKKLGEPGEEETRWED